MVQRLYRFACRPIFGHSYKFVVTRKELTNVQTNPEISATDS